MTEAKYEQELKLTAVDVEVLDQVLGSELVRRLDSGVGGEDATRYVGAYYDTETRELAASRCSLRARREGDRWRAALKYGGAIVAGLSRRHELEDDISGWLGNAAQLPSGELKDRVTQIIAPQAPLIVRVTTHMRRSIRQLNFHGTDIELAADRGTIKGASRQVELYEVELELKRGDLDRVVELGGMLARQFALTPSSMTKHRIGLRLG